MAVALLAGAALIGISLWPLMRGPEIPDPGGYAQSRTSGSQGARTQQGSGESAAAKQNETLAGQEEGQAARQIRSSAKPITLNDEQKRQLGEQLAANAKPQDPTTLSISIGAAVPRQVELTSLPNEASAILGGFEDDDYLALGDQLIIVDRNSRRIAAIIPEVFQPR